MATWRRLAIEAVPACRRIIEQSRHPGEMWEHFAWKVSVAYKQVPPDEEMIRRIYGLASACSRKSLPEGTEYLGLYIETFFTNVLNSTHEAAKDAGTRITNPDFVFNMEALAYLSSDQVAAINQRFYAAQHHSARMMMQT